MYLAKTQNGADQNFAQSLEDTMIQKWSNQSIIKVILLITNIDVDVESELEILNGL